MRHRCRRLYQPAQWQGADRACFCANDYNGKRLAVCGESTAMTYEILPQMTIQITFLGRNIIIRTNSLAAVLARKHNCGMHGDGTTASG